MDIIRNADGSLVVPVSDRGHDASSGPPGSSNGDENDATSGLPKTLLLHPGEGGYDEALAEWDLQQNPDREPIVSTANGRQQAMTLVHAVANSSDHDVAQALEAVEDPEASGEALRFVLIGGVHSVEDFAAEVAEECGGDPMAPHQMTKIIGEVLAKLDQ